jgi:hypothetical protein
MLQIKDRYYATRLALNLSSTPTQSAAKQEVEGIANGLFDMAQPFLSIIESRNV